MRKILCENLEPLAELLRSRGLSLYQVQRLGTQLVAECDRDERPVSRETAYRWIKRLRAAGHDVVCAGTGPGKIWRIV